MKKTFTLIPIVLVAIIAALTFSINAQETKPAPENTQTLTTFQPFTFAVISDPHCAAKPQKGVEQYGTGLERFLNCFKAIEQLPPQDKPDFVLVTGDINIEALRPALDQIKIPMHLIAGNHEGKKQKKQLRDLFPQDFKQNGLEADYYAFSHKGARFIGLCNAADGGDHIGHLASEGITPRGQSQWLEFQLQQPEKHKFIFAHIPPEPNNQDRNMYLAQNDSRYFNNLIQHTQPTAMFFGHLHRPTNEYSIEKTKVFTLRACCWNSEQYPIGFMIVKVTEEGITTQEIDTGFYNKTK